MLGERGAGACLALAAAMERSSEHPLARALVDAAGSRPLPLAENTLNAAGAGLQRGEGRGESREGGRLRTRNSEGLCGPCLRVPRRLNPTLNAQVIKLNHLFRFIQVL